MDNKSIQTRRILEAIMSNQLKSGVNPTEETIEFLFGKIIKGNELGMPMTDFEPIEKRERSDIKSYNSLLDDIHFDISCLFESFNEQHKEILNNFSIKEDERIKLMAKIKSLQNRISKLTTESSKSNDFNYSFEENFSSFKNIDMENSNAFIDLNEKRAMLPISNKDVVKVPLSNARVKITNITPTEKAYINEVSPLSNLLDDYLNTFWATKVIYPKGFEIDNSVSLELEIELADSYKISEIQLTPQSSGLMEIELYYLLDGGWHKFDFKEKTILNKKETWFSFPEPIKTEKIKLILSKSSPDIELTEKEYLFGLKNISIDYREYEPTAKIETKELTINDREDKDTLEELSITADEIVPQGSEIRYYLKIKENNNFFNDSEFDKAESWHAENYYDEGGADGGSYCGDSSSEGMYQDVELIPGREYTLSGYLKREISMEPINIIREHDGEVIEVLSLEDNQEWNHFEYTFLNEVEGTQRIRIKDSDTPQTEVLADKFFLVEGSEAGKVDYSNPYIISPENRKNPKNKTYLKLKNTLKGEANFSTENLSLYKNKHGKDFKSYNLSYKPIKKEAEVVAGVNRWSVYKYQKEINLDSQVGLFLWNKRKMPTFTKKNYFYYPMGQSFTKTYKDNVSLDATDNSHYLFSTWLYLDEPKSITKDGIDYSECYQNEALYVNGMKLERQVNGSTYLYDIQLDRGWNKIDIVIYLGDSTKASFFEDLIDLSSFEKWRAKREGLKQVSLSSLMSGYDYEDDSVFAIEGNSIIFNNSEAGINNNYSINYKYNINRVKSIKIMAEMESENTYITPKIDSIKVNAKY
jgi:hypothetical protein